MARVHAISYFYFTAPSGGESLKDFIHSLISCLFLLGGIPSVGAAHITKQKSCSDHDYDHENFTFLAIGDSTEKAPPMFF